MQYYDPFSRLLVQVHGQSIENVNDDVEFNSCPVPVDCNLGNLNE